MRHAQRRNATRSRAWPETIAYLEFLLPNGHETIRKYRACGDVRDIGAGGMFLHTSHSIPVETSLGITICFDSENSMQNLSISAKGQVVRSENDGVGIRFTSINLNRSRDCVIKKINRTHPNEKTNESAGLCSNLKGAETVLVAEDDKDVRDLVSSMLQEQGYKVLVGENGTKALTALQHFAGSIHLLLTDVDMPDMNGKQLFEEVLSYCPDARVLYMSGRVDIAIAERGSPENGEHFLQKPFSVKALSEKVREVLGQVELKQS